ncbi:hypothetical protein KEJ51_07440 [Candidatus Bathyarchaeota archaeon]|nr:hypothetical protein [Candidatus Bathyarchaeota archaeon]
MILSIMMDKVLQDLRKSEDSSLSLKVACDILRVLTIMGGSAWMTELEQRLLELWSLDEEHLYDLGSLQGEVEKALELLRGRNLLNVRRCVRGDLETNVQREENLYSICDFTSLLRVFGSDGKVLRYRMMV